MNKELSDDAPVKFYAFLDSQDFYELMQAYRLAPIDAAKEFEAVRFALHAAIAQPVQPAHDLIKECLAALAEESIYCTACEQHVSGPCNSRECSTPETLAQLVQPAVLPCKKCGGEMAPGQAIEQ